MVSFSVDGFTKSPTNRFRVGATFEKTVDNILRLAAIRREGKFKRPYIIVEKIRFKNPETTARQEEISALRRRFLDAGVDEIIEKAEYVWAEASAPEPPRPRLFRMHVPWYAMVICFDGTVTPAPRISTPT